MTFLTVGYSNGVLSFEMPFTFCCAPRTFPIYPTPLIAPFWHDFDPTLGGNIYYRQTNNSQELQLFQTSLSSALNTRGLGNFSPTLLFIVTWDQVPEFLGSTLVNYCYIAWKTYVACFAEASSNLRRPARFHILCYKLAFRILLLLYFPVI